METKLAILRGINVGGKRKIRMIDLKSMFEDLGFTQVQTYIQSGNVVFKAHEQSSVLENQIKKSIEEKFDFDVPVIIRTKKEMEALIQNNPFLKENAETEKLYLTFLKEAPQEVDENFNNPTVYLPDKFTVVEKDVYIYCEGKYHQSKLTNNFIEKKLKVEATTRNWKTVMKLSELINSPS